MPFCLVAVCESGGECGGGGGLDGGFRHVEEFVFIFFLFAGTMRGRYEWINVIDVAEMQRMNSQSSIHMVVIRRFS